MTTPSPSTEARLAILRMAVKKEPFSIDDIRHSAPGIPSSTIHNQIARLKREGLLTGLARSIYIARCAVDTVKSKDPQKPDGHEMLTFLKNPRTFDEIREEFDLTSGLAGARLRKLIGAGKIHKHKYRGKRIYATTKAAITCFCAPPVKAPNAQPVSGYKPPRFGGVSKIAVAVLRHNRHFQMQTSAGR